MASGTEIKAALTMVITKVEASMLVMGAVMMEIGIISVMGLLKPLLVDLILIPSIITSVSLIG